MSATNETYTYDYLLRFGQTLGWSLVVTFFLLLIPVFGGESFDFGLFIDGSLALTLVVYALHYHHMFNANIHLFHNELQINRPLLDNQIYDFAEVRRIQFTQLPAPFLNFPSGTRLRMTIVGEDSSSNIEVSDLKNSQAFIDSVEMLAQENGVRICWLNEKGEFLTSDSDHSVSL